VAAMDLIENVALGAWRWWCSGFGANTTLTRIREWRITYRKIMYVANKEQPTVAGLETDSGACGFVVVVVVVVVDVWQSSATAWLQCVATCRCTNRSHGQ
jgi:hypothetical protein